MLCLALELWESVFKRGGDDDDDDDDDDDNNKWIV